MKENSSVPHATNSPDRTAGQAPPAVMVLTVPRRTNTSLLATTVMLFGLLASICTALLVSTGRPDAGGAPSLRAAQITSTAAGAGSQAGVRDVSLTSTSGGAARAAGPEAPAAAPAASSVMIMNYAYSPATLTVPVGTTVTWTNDDQAPHTVTSSSGPAKLDSPQLAQGDTWSFTFTKPGTYAYYCAVHPDMKGTVTVTASSTKPAPSTAPSSTAPASAPPSTTGMGGMPSGSGSASCTDIADAVAQPFETHLDHGHLEESPAQQVADILNISQYVKTHTTLIEAMLQPLYLLAPAVARSADVFVQHVYHGHLEESPSQQAADILNPDQYAKTHTVLIENMAKPLTDFTLGGC